MTLETVVQESARAYPAQRTGALRRIGFLFIPVLFALAAHLGFSWMGYTPTDDGWVLAGARRILAGQIPHRDFVALQPAGSEFLHLGEVALGGGYTYWLSRLIVWLQFSLIGWAWPQILAKLTDTTLNRFRAVFFGLLCFLFTSCTFLVMPWPTTDGLFLISLGLLLCLRTEWPVRGLGYFLIGFSYLCKQNFAAVFPGILILLGDWKKIRYWGAALCPGFLYAALLAIAGALPPGLIQLVARNSIFEHGIKPYLVSKQLFVAAAVGFVSVTLLFRKGSKAPDWGICLGYLVLLGSALSLRTDLYWFSSHTAFVLFGMVSGVALGLLFHSDVRSGTLRAGAMVLLLAWALSVSMGFNYPTLGSGLLALFLIQVPFSTRGKWFSWPVATRYAMAILLVAAVASYVVGRRTHIYRDQPASELVAKLDGVLPGGELIRTNPNTYEYLADLRFATQKVGGTRYAIVPGIPGYWVKADQLNPLVMDWPLAEAMPNPKMVDGLIANLAAQKGKVVLIVERVEPATLQRGFLPLREALYPPDLLAYVRTNFQKVGETKFFELRQ